MDSRNRTRPLANSQPVVISASTLKGAYKLVKEEFGDDAIILGSRTVTRRQALGLGHEKIVEVMVQDPVAPTKRRRKPMTGSPSPLGTVATATPASKEMLAEVERIEELVKAIAEDYEKLDPQASITRDNPLAESLIEGGATPSAGAIRLAVGTLRIPVFVMIRPRGGDFCYSDLEFEQMKADVRFCRDVGAQGVVFGILNPDGTVDQERNAELVRLASPMGLTFHRAFDMTADAFRAMEEIKALGIGRILTSGHENTAPQGAGLLRELVRAAGEELTIMAGSGVRPENVLELVERSGVKAVHFSAASEFPSRMQFRNPRVSMGKNGTAEYALLRADAQKVLQLREALNRLPGQRA